MGFLNNFLKGEAKKIVSDVFANDSDNFGNRSDSGMYNGTSYKNDTSSTRKHNGQSNMSSGEQQLRSRLNEVIVTEYGSCELKQNVSASELGAEHGAVDYSYGLYKSGELKLLIMVITDRNAYRRKCMRLSREAAEMRGVPCLSFFTHLPNEMSYISERLRKLSIS